MIRTVDFLPEIFRTPTNRQVLHATLDQLVQEPAYQRSQGFIGRRYGPGVTVEDRYLTEPDKTRRDYQLETATVFLEEGNRRAVDALTYPGYLDALKRLNGPITRPDELFQQEYYAVDFFVDYDKFVNFSQYYWLAQGPEAVTLTAPGANQAFDVERYIVGQQTYTTDQVRLLSPVTWNKPVTFSNGMRIRFVGNIKPLAYRGQEFYVEGVGTADGIKLLPVSNFVIPELYNYPVYIKREPVPWDIYPWDMTAWDGSQIIPGTDIDYITINRASEDLNPWTRSNRWFHIDVLNYSAEINGQTLVLDDTFRGKRPILEFRPGIKLINFGTKGLQPISLIDYTITNAFTQVAGQTSCTIDGIELFAGMKVIFAGDQNPLVARQVYLVEQITPVLGEDSLLYLQPIEGQVAEEGSVTVCTLGLTQQGFSFYYSNGEWSTAAECQQKHRINQAPLYDVFDTNGVSFSDTMVYPESTFRGSPLFQYAVGAGVYDAVLKFPLQYASVGNIGDILFWFNLYRDSFTYLNGLVTDTVGLRTGYVHQYVARTTYRRLIGYQTASFTPNTVDTAVVSQQPQIFEFDYTSGAVILDVAVWQQDQYPDITNIVKVSVNDELQDTDTYTYRILDAFNLEVYPVPESGAGVGVQTEIIFDVDPAPTSLVVAAVLSDQTSKTAYFAVPTNLSVNALNQDLTQVTLGSLRDHFVSICQNIQGFTGKILAANNSRDLGNLIPYGTNLIQNSAALAIPAVFLREQSYSISSALDFSSAEYQRYKDLMLDFIWKNEFLDETTAEILDSAIDALKSNRNSSNPFYWSDIITAGIFESTTYNWFEGASRTFDLIYNYDFSTANYQGLNVYVNDVILCRNRDYVVDTQVNTVVIEQDLLADGDTVVIREYQQTYGNFVPATPSSLRLYPAYFPEIYVDNTYATPTTVIRGHDGSITPAFGDYRDQVLLEFETRIYSNIRGAAEYPLDYTEFLPGAFRGVTQDNINSQTIINNEFVRWLGANRVDYKQQDYQANNQYTWNYSQSGASLTYPSGQNAGGDIPMPGYWRQVYWYFYDTDEPQNYPWQMLGFSNRPVWWEEQYGPAPYTSGNQYMWEDIQEGRIREPGNERVDTVYARPGLLQVLPVDAQGQLLSPFECLVAGFNPATWQANWSIGGGSPAETAWRKSSAWPFAMQKLLLLLRPAQYLNYYIDRDRYQYNAEFKQWLYQQRNRLTAQDLQIYGTGTAVNSYVNFIVDYNKSYGLPGTENLTARLDNLDVRLAYRVAGFTDKRYLQLLSDRSGPNSSNLSILIPDENYNILLYRNEIFDSINYSAVTIERTESGWAVYGNSLSNPYFQILPSIINNNYTTVRIGNTTIRIQKDFSDTVTLIPYGYIFRSVNAVVDFLISYGQFLSLSGLSYNTLENTVLLTWEQMAQEYVYWYNQGWSVGAMIQLNPSSTRLEFYRQNAVVVNLLEANREDILVNQNKQALQIRDYSVYRDGNLFELTSLNENTIGYVNLKLTNYENIIILDNVTDFGDVIYEPLTGLRQGRLIYQGIKSAGWNGTMDAPGFIINLSSVAEWDTGLKYAKGQVVKFKNFYYQANTTVDPSDTFDYNLWTKIIYRPDQEGMLPNLALKAVQSTEYYNQHSNNLNVDSEVLGFGITGFRPREYMASIELDEVSQMNAYQDFIGVKGTPRSLYFYDQAKVAGDDLSYDIYENWAIQRATYGATATNAFVDFTLDATALTSNPSTSQFVVAGETTEADQATLITDLYATSYPIKTTEILPLLTQENPDVFLPTAGYVESQDVEVQIFSIEDLNSVTAQLDKITNLAEIWVAKVNQSEWAVYKCQNLQSTLVLAQDNLDGQTLLVFDLDHGLVNDQIIIIKEFNEALQGAFRVVSVTSTTSVLIAESLPDDVTTLIGSGIVFQLENVRVAQPSDIADMNILYQLVSTNKVWVDDNGQGRWETLEKQNPYTEQAAYEYSGTVNFGSSVIQTADSGNLLIGAPGSYSSGAVIPYTHVANTYVAGSPLTIPSLWTGYGDFGRVGDSSGNDWAAFSVGLYTLPGIFTDYRVVAMKKNNQGFQPRQLLSGGSSGTAGAFVGQIKFSEDYNWLYVSNPSERLVRVYQRNPWQEQTAEFLCTGRRALFEFSDSVRVTDGSQISVRLNLDNDNLLAYNQEYTATTTTVRLRVPPPPPFTVTTDITIATSEFTVQSTANLGIGQLVSGIGVPGNTKIIAVDDATNVVTVSQLFTATAQDINLTITNIIYIGRWTTDPEPGYWGSARNPLIPNGGLRTFPIDMLAGATSDPGSVGVYYNGQLLRPNNFPEIDGDYTYDFPNRQVIFNFTPPAAGAQAVTYQSSEYYSELATVNDPDSYNFTFGSSCATNQDGSLLAVGDADTNTSTVVNDHDGLVYVYDRGIVRHMVSNVAQSLYSTPANIIGQPQVWLNGQMLYEDTDVTFGSFVYEPAGNVSDPVYTGPANISINTGVAGNIGDILDISYNNFKITQAVSNPQANVGNSEFGAAVSLNGYGSALIVGAPNGNTISINTGFAARIENQAAVYGSITGTTINPTVSRNSDLRINDYYVKFAQADVSNVSLSTNCTITTAAAHGYYTGEIVKLGNINGGVLYLNTVESGRGYFAKVTGPTTFNIFDYGNVSNVSLGTVITVTSNVANYIGYGQSFGSVFSNVEISGVQGIANLNSTAANPYWMARRANGNSATQFEVLRGVGISSIISGTDDDGATAVTIVNTFTNPQLQRGARVAIQSPTTGLNNLVFYAGEVDNIGRNFVLYQNPELTSPVVPTGNTTNLNGTLGVYIDGTGWGNYVSGGQVLRYFNTTGSLPAYNANVSQGWAFDDSLNGVVNVINSKNIPNLQAANAAGKLQLSIIDLAAGVPNNLLTLAPGTENNNRIGYNGSALKSLGILPYYTGGAQIFGGSYPTLGARFGYRIDQDWTTDQVVISSEFGTTAAGTTFDKDTTTFDSRTTRFEDLYLKSGSVDVYDLLPSANPTPDNPSKLVWDRQLQDYLVRSGQEFGHSVSIAGNNIIIGSPMYTVNDVAQGRALIFSGLRTGWKTIRLEPNQVDVHLLNEVTIYNKESKVTINYLDFIDPIQGRILGAAQQNIDLISPTDPAGYNNGDVNNIGVNWGEVQLGYIWWDTTNIRFLEYHTQDINLSARIWGGVFPGSSADVYQWIESLVPPAEYTGPGVARDITSYSSYDVITDTNSIITKYYFWVSDLTSVLPYSNKTLSLQSIQQYILNPRSSGISYIAAINPSTVAIYNSNSDFVAQENVLHISYDIVPQDNNIHVEYDLIQQDNPRQFMDDATYEKFVDSFAGIDAIGNPVPDPNLPPGLLYGISFDPRQSMFRDRFLALKNYISRVNEILMTFTFSEESSMDFLNSQEEPPAAGELESPGQLWWNFQVANLTELGYQDLDSVPLGYRYLVTQDSRYNNFWTIHQVTGAVGSRTTVVIRVQTYKTSQYWSYVNWYAEGFDPLQRPLFVVETLAQAQELLLPDNGVVQVTMDNPLGFELYQNRVIDSYRDTTTLEWVTVTEFTRVGLENGTVQISDLIYDYSKLINPDQPPQIETRQIINSINFEILVDSRLILRNQAMGLMFNFILGEQIDCNWLYKTSLIDITHPVRKLLPYRTFKRDNQDFVYGYIEEVKPYHVFIKDFSLVYTAGPDLYPGDITDFDVPATFNAQYDRYISPILENDVDYPNYDKYGIYGVGPYAQFKGYIGPTSNSGNTVLTVTELLKGQIYVGATVTGGIVQASGSTILAYLGQNQEGQNQYKISGYYTYESDTGTMEINGIWSTIPYRNWYNNYGLRVIDIMVTNPGSGYSVAPTVTVNGVTSDPVKARAILNSNSGINNILIEYSGGRYLTQPTVTLSAPDSEDGVQATAYPVTDAQPVRNFETTLVYNRMNLRPTFTEWIAGFTYFQGDLVKFNNAVYASNFDYNQNSQFDFTNWTLVPPGELEGVDRTYGYYQGNSELPGLDLDQLISGLTYPGVVTGRRYLGSWDTSPWSLDPFESDNSRVQTIIAGGTYPDRSLPGDYAGIPPLEAWDVNVYGGAYVDAYSSHAPEELVPGAVFDTLDFTVRTVPGQDNIGLGWTSPLQGRIYQGDAQQDTFSFQSLIKFPEQVIVFRKNSNDTKVRLEETVDYTVNWPDLTVTINTVPAADEKIAVIAVGLGGGNQLLRYSEITDAGIAADGTIDVPVQYDAVYSLPVFVDGNALILNTDYSITEYQPVAEPDANDITITRITFANAVAAGSRIDYTVLGEGTGSETYDYSLPTTAEIPLSGTTGNISSIDFSGTNPIAAIVEVNGLRLRGPHCVTYTGDGETLTFAAGWQKDVPVESIVASDVVVYVNDQETEFWDGQFVAQHDAYEITFNTFTPELGARIVIAVWTASEYVFDFDAETITVDASYSGSDVYITTWQETAQQNFLNTVTVGQSIIPVAIDTSINTRASWSNGSSVMTVGFQTTGFWNRDGIGFDYPAYGSGVTQGDTNPNGAPNPANTAVLSQMLGYGNTIIVLDVSGINIGDIVEGSGITEDVAVTQILGFKNRYLQDNWAVSVNANLLANGLVWNRQYSNSTTPYLQSTLYGISTGPYITLVDSHNNVLYSNNAIDWNYTNLIPESQLRSVANGNIGSINYYIAVGQDSSVLVSTDGIDWAPQNSILPYSNIDFSSITYGNGKFVAVGDQGNIFVTSDAVNWSQANSGTIEDLSSVTYHGNVFAATGSNAMILISDDAVTWTRRWLNYVSNIAVTDSGWGYTQVPNITIANAVANLGITATAFAAIEGGVGNISVINGSAGFSRAPNVVISQNNVASFTGNVGTGAQAVAVLGTTGPVGYVALVVPGQGYNYPPTISFVGGNGIGATASSNVANGKITDITLITGGSGYTVGSGNVQVVITPTGGDTPTAVANAIAMATSSVASITVTAAGNGYTSYDLITESNVVPLISFESYMVQGRSSLYTQGNIGQNFINVESVANLEIGNEIEFTDSNANMVYSGVITSIYPGNLAIGVNPVLSNIITVATTFESFDQGSNTVTAQFSAFANAGVQGLILTGAGSGYNTAPAVTIAPPAAGNTALASSNVAAITESNLNDIALISNIWIAAGDQAAVIYSQDTVTWIENSVNANIQLNTVFGSDQHFAVAGQSGNLYVTANVQQSWQKIASGTNQDIAQGLYAAGNYVYVASSGVTAYSNTANSNWTVSATNTRTTSDLYGLTYTGDQWCAVGDHSTILRTGNIANGWVQYAQEYLNDSQYGNVSGLDVYTIVGKDGLVYRSQGNVYNFTLIDTGSTVDLNAVTYGQGLFVAVGESGTAAVSANANVWSFGSIAPGINFNDVAYTGASMGIKYVAVGDNGQAWQSANGVAWTRMTGISTNANLHCVTVGNAGKVIIGGENGTLLTSVSVVGLSDEFVLTLQGSSETFTLSDPSLRTFVTASSTMIATSTEDVSVSVNGDDLVWGVDFSVDGINPNVVVTVAEHAASVYDTVVVTTTLPTWYDVAYGADKFIVQGDNGITWNGSANGVQWTQVPTLTGVELLGIEYANTISQFVSVGQSAGSQQIGTQSYIATSYTGDYLPVIFAPDFKKIQAGMLVTGDYVRTNTLVTGTDYADRLVYVNTPQTLGSRQNSTVTFTPSQIENIYPTENIVTNGWRPWVTVSGNRQFFNEDYVAQGAAVRLVYDDLPPAAIVQMLDSSQNAVPNELDFKLWKDMNDNTAVYRMNQYNVTETAAAVELFDDIIYLEDATKMFMPRLDLNQMGLAFVGGERIAYRYVDYTTNTISGLLRGVGGTSVQRHVAGAEVVNANSDNIIPLAYRDKIVAQEFSGDGIARTFTTDNIKADIANEVRLVVAGQEIPTRSVTISASGANAVFTAEAANVSGNAIGNIAVDRNSQILVAINGVALPLANANSFMGDNSTVYFLANNITTSNVQNIVVTVNNQLITPNNISITGGHPNVYITPALDANSLVHISENYAVINRDPVQVAIAPVPAANTLVTIAADFYATELFPVIVTTAEPPLPNTRVIVGIDTTKNWYNAPGDGIRLQDQQTLAARFLQGDA